MSFVLVDRDPYERMYRFAFIEEGRRYRGEKVQFERPSRKAPNPETQRRIALAPGTLETVAQGFGVSVASVSRYRRKFSEPRKRGRLNCKGSTDATSSTASGVSGVADRGTRNGDPLAGVETGQGIEDWLL